MSQDFSRISNAKWVPTSKSFSGAVTAGENSAQKPLQLGFKGVTGNFYSCYRYV